jgi:hypothetical protein
MPVKNVSNHFDRVALFDPARPNHLVLTDVERIYPRTQQMSALESLTNLANIAASAPRQGLTASLGRLAEEHAIARTAALGGFAATVVATTGFCGLLSGYTKILGRDYRINTRIWFFYCWGHYYK